ncbi:hypothetical protein CAL12_21320 [Bordetella genomosp. 8]|uniref:Uncharacterized protein n=1 Tax=Bordetella genomosp. 8 TaxID=1416806 RepID=A0A1W6YPU6_9BORD|nr:hypothetical protein [Bordetella genomosp. 8]ARP83105.1 hypothetical protein CAL12_21320 [Bordetella genomosp. 8]
MELYMTIGEGYRLTLDVDESASGYGWYIYLALSKEQGKGTLVISDEACESASEAAAAGMQALERYKTEQRISVVTPPAVAVY